LLQPWFEKNLLPTEIIEEALDEVAEMGFTSGVCLSHYNEPLMDERIVYIANMVKSYGLFKPIFLNTNGDFLTEELARALDGVLDRILVSLYMDEPKKSERARWIESIFHTTEAIPLTHSTHIATHFSPAFDVVSLAVNHRDNKCDEPKVRVVISHNRQFLLCCDDVVGNFDLGTFPETSIKDYWFGEKHTQIVRDLAERGGRRKHDYCASCPRR
jgi:MoaA/NifB/PqqE/SkfB family radical SAM enzyme